LPGLSQYSDLLSGQLRQLSDLFPGHDKRIGKFRCRRCQDYNVAAFEYFFRDRDSAGVCELPVAADDPRSGFGPPHRDGWQRQIYPLLLKQTRFGSEPRGALPCRKQSRCDSDTLTGLLRPSQMKRSRGAGGGGARGQMQELPA
jgi:hypothetical protein